MKSIAQSAQSLGLVLFLLLAWQGLHTAIGDEALASPWQAWQELLQLGGDITILPDLAATGRALLISVIIALGGGLFLGVALGVHRLSGEVGEPLIVTLGAIPKVTLYPVILLMFGLGTAAKVAFGVLHGIVPVTLFGMNAIRQIRPVYTRTARVMHLSPWQTALYILLPAILPEVFAGIRIGTSLTILGVIVGELFASQKGVGYLLMTAADRGDTPMVAAVAVFVTVFSVMLNTGLLYLERRMRHAT